MAQRTFIREMQRAGGAQAPGYDGSGIKYLFDPIQEGDLADAAKRAEVRISAMLDAPLSAGAVERILQITPAERIRWAKDGRLPYITKVRSNRSDATYGQAVYSRQLIREIEQQPDLIAEWRRQDPG